MVKWVDPDIIKIHHEQDFAVFRVTSHHVRLSKVKRRDNFSLFKTSLYRISEARNRLRKCFFYRVHIELPF